MTFTITPIYKRFWWPHPYAVERKRLWVKVVVDYRYEVNRNTLLNRN